MDIYLKEKSNTKSSFQFPSMPESIKVKGNANYQNYDIIEKGAYAFPSGLELQTVQWKGFFWGESRKGDAGLNRKWVSPASCVNKLETWKEKGTILNLIVSGGGINKDVTIKSFEYEQSGGRGDYEYSISFVVYRTLKMYEAETEDVKATTKKKMTKKRETKPAAKKYTVVSGDNLWSIARKFYGGTGTDWKKIYDANQSVIESTAKNHGYSSSNNGWWIFPGCVLTIP